MQWTAVILTGGGSTRLGRDKATATIGGRRMVDRLLEQVPSGVPVVVVGPDPGLGRAITVTREEPAGGGPAAAAVAGARAVATPVLALVAVDMPWAVPEAASLLGLLGGHDAVVPVSGGRAQPLCAVYRTAVLRAQRGEEGRSMRGLLDTLDVRYVDREPGAHVDIDTPADLAAARRRAAIMDVRTKGTAMDDWVAAAVEALGLATDVDVDLILDVAKDAAHGVQRPAAPVTTYLLGVAVASGADPAHAAATLSELAGRWRSDADA